ncbi:MAG: hypothetical protein CSA49_05100 [Gammaproteobacteria bacterium]|nr:MAG: hypothetical protein CSA49_05100 [Gammaproteobacteria bacterium]
MSNIYSEDELKRLSWQCRRGIKEVEVLLAPFFENHFAELSDADKQLFVELPVVRQPAGFMFCTAMFYCRQNAR